MSFDDVFEAELFPVRPETLERSWETSSDARLSDAFEDRMRRALEVVILVTMAARPGREAELAEALHEFAAASRLLPGMISTEVYRSAPDPTGFLLVERLADREVLGRHMASDYFRRLQEVQAEVLARPVEAAFYSPTS